MRLIALTGEVAPQGPRGRGIPQHCGHFVNSPNFFLFLLKTSHTCNRISHSSKDFFNTGCTRQLHHVTRKKLSRPLFTNRQIHVQPALLTNSGIIMDHSFSPLPRFCPEGDVSDLKCQQQPLHNSLIFREWRLNTFAQSPYFFVCFNGSYAIMSSSRSPRS